MEMEMEVIPDEITNNVQQVKNVVDEKKDTKKVVLTPQKHKNDEEFDIFEEDVEEENASTKNSPTMKTLESATNTATTSASSVDNKPVVEKI